MRHNICILTIILLFCVLTTPAAEPWVDSTGKVFSYEEIGKLAMEEVRLAWRPTEWKDIEFAPGKIGYLGMTYVEKKEISIWIRREHSPAQVAETIVHELGHAFDIMYLNPELRNEWISIRNLPTDTPWDVPCNKCSDRKVGAGDFAESVAWTFQGSNAGFNSKLGPPPNEVQQKLIQEWFETLPNISNQKIPCVRVKKMRNLSVAHREHQEIRDGQVVFVHHIEICEQPPLFWNIEKEEPSYFSNQCTGMR